MPAGIEIEYTKCAKCNYFGEISVRQTCRPNTAYLKLCDHCKELPVLCELCDQQIEWFDGMKFQDLVIETDSDWPYILCGDCDPSGYNVSEEEIEDPGESIEVDFELMNIEDC